MKRDSSPRWFRSNPVKFHLEQTGKKSFVLHPVAEVRFAASAGADEVGVAIANHDDAQPLRFALRVGDAVNGCVLTLPDGLRISFNQKLEKGQFILCRGNEACVADANRKPTAKLALSRAAVLPQGESKLGVGFLGTAPAHFTLTAWVLGAGEALPSRRR